MSCSTPSTEASKCPPHAGEPGEPGKPAAPEPWPARLRPITHSQRVHETNEGLGSRVRRYIGNSAVRCLPPFVIGEYLRISEVGRPPHPARGMQKISLVLKGKMQLDYSPTDVIELETGDLASLMVGRGVIRSVRAIPGTRDAKDAGSRLPSPVQDYQSKMECRAFQLYVDVPEPFKRVDPSHINLCHSDIRTLEPAKGVTVRVITGSGLGTQAEQMLTITPVDILDVTLEPGASIQVPVRSNWNAFVFVVEGSVAVQGQDKKRFEYVEFRQAAKPRAGSSDSASSDETLPPADNAVVELAVDAAAKQQSRLFFCSAEPLGQPIFRQGPFVDVSMNWIHQAYDDYTEQKNGFESRKEWNKHRETAEDPAVGSDASDAAVSPYNPCEDGSEGNCECSDSDASKAAKSANGADVESGESGEASRSARPGPSHKASRRNVFPPGSVNGAENSAEFNDTEDIADQQEKMVPKRRRSSSDEDDSTPRPSKR